MYTLITANKKLHRMDNAYSFLSQKANLSFYRLEKVTDENERLTEELKFKEQKVQSLQKRFVKLISFLSRCWNSTAPPTAMFLKLQVNDVISELTEETELKELNTTKERNPGKNTRENETNRRTKRIWRREQKKRGSE